LKIESEANAVRSGARTRSASSRCNNGHPTKRLRGYH